MEHHGCWAAHLLATEEGYGERRWGRKDNSWAAVPLATVRRRRGKRRENNDGTTCPLAGVGGEEE